MVVGGENKHARYSSSGGITQWFKHIFSNYGSDGQGFEQPLRVKAKGQKGKGQGQDFHIPEKPLPLTRVRDFCKGYSRVKPFT
jgi:hypothetical protein